MNSLISEANGCWEPAPAARARAAEPVPLRLRAWHLACPASELKPGSVLSFSFSGEEIVLYRGASGRVFALASHCAHMGTHLRGGCVIEDKLRCPLHHWTFGGDGALLEAGRRASLEGMGQRAYPVAERYGMIFVFNGPEALFPPPEFGDEGPRGIDALAGEAVHLDCPWQAVAANGFDRQHLETVHERALREEPRVERLGPHCLRLRYVSRVTGASLADRAMKRISGDVIKVAVTCWGGVTILVESDLGRTRSALILGLRPAGTAGVAVTPVFCVYRGAAPWIDALRLRAARWLFSGFLRRDVAILGGMRFDPNIARGEDPALAQFLEFIQELPRCAD